MIVTHDALERMKEIDEVFSKDPEGWHIAADRFLLDCLIVGAALGAALEIEAWFEGTDKWTLRSSSGRYLDLHPNDKRAILRIEFEVIKVQIDFMKEEMRRLRKRAIELSSETILPPKPPATP